MRRSRFDAKRIARIGVLAALSAILYALPGIPVIPPIYKLDFSAVPCLMAGFAMGPVEALIVTLIKDLTGLLHSSSMGVGEIADFVMTGAFAAVAALIYMRGKTLRGAVIAMIAGVAAMCVAGAAMNYFVLIPFYSGAFHMPVESIVGMVANTVPAVDTLWKLILLAVVPFNVLKGIVVSVTGAVLYRYLRPLLEGKKASA